MTFIDTVVLVYKYLTNILSYFLIGDATPLCYSVLLKNGIQLIDEVNHKEVKTLLDLERTYIFSSHGEYDVSFCKDAMLHHGFSSHYKEGQDWPEYLNAGKITCYSILKENYIYLANGANGKEIENVNDLGNMYIFTSEGYNADFCKREMMNRNFRLQYGVGEDGDPAHLKYGAKKCYFNLMLNGVQIFKKINNKKVETMRDLENVYIFNDLERKYDIDFCKKALKKKGFLLLDADIIWPLSSNKNLTMSYADKFIQQTEEDQNMTKLSQIGGVCTMNFHKHNVLLLKDNDNHSSQEQCAHIGGEYSSTEESKEYLRQCNLGDCDTTSICVTDSSTTVSLVGQEQIAKYQCGAIKGIFITA